MYSARVFPQADICHAYQLVKANGVPAERIITMMVDDIAYNRRRVLFVKSPRVKLVRRETATGLVVEPSFPVDSGRCPREGVTADNRAKRFYA